ncbi:MAG: hypothetical protein ACJ8FS_16315 [Sphingomicrobium sp.]
MIKQQGLSGMLDDAANSNKHSAKECKLWYKTIVRQVLSQHHWGLATVRTSLASAPTNNRPGEWTAAYLPPSDMAFPVMVGPYSNSVGVSYYQGVGYLVASLYGKPIFLYEGSTIYSIIEGAVLDYVSFNLTEMDFNDAVEGLIVLFLASRLARSVAKDDKLADELYNQAIRRMNVDIAQSLNMAQPRYGDTFSDAEKARAGLDPMIGVYGFPY